jgi:xanthine dehydrogenase accessory factor
MSETLTVFEEVVRLQHAGEPCVLATVIASSGSAPRKCGARMVIRQDGTITGTVGGGKPELETIAAGLEVLREMVPRTVSFTLVEEFGHVCGGSLQIYLEPLGSAPRLVICGAGHVGTATAAVAAQAGFRVTVVDDRPAQLAPGRLPAACQTVCGGYGESLAKLPVTPDTAVVITTPGFQSDFAATRAALATPAGYIGIIGSRRKRETLLATLAAEGYDEATIARLTIPVGLPIGGDTPGEIAVSIVAQLIERRHRHVAKNRGAHPGSRPVPADGVLQAPPSPP